MAYARMQAFSIVLLVILAAGAGYLSSRGGRFSLSIPRGLSVSTAFLPIVSGVLLELGYYANRRQGRRRLLLPRGEKPRPPFVTVANTLIFIYSTAVITLLGTHAAPPAGLDCAWRDKWTAMFRNKNVEAIRTIQQAFSCCGFKHSRDMAWPFPDKEHPDTGSCEKTFGHTNGCFGPWKAEEKRTAGLLMGVVGLVFIWQIAIIAISIKRGSWIHRIFPDRISRMIADEEHGNPDSQRAILFPAERYTDRIENASEDGDENQSGQRLPGILTDGDNAEGDAAREHENAWSGP